MAENNLQGELSKEGTTEQANQTSDKSTTQNNHSQEEQTSETKLFTQEELDRIIAKRLKKAQEHWEKTKDLTELERLKQENETLKKEVIKAKAFDSFEKAIAKEVKNTRGLFKVLFSEMQISDNGEIQNLSDLIKEAKNEFPEFFNTQFRNSIDAGKKGDAEKANFDMNSLIRKSLGLR